MNDVLVDAPLTWQGVAAVAAGARVSLSVAARERMAHARALVEAIVARGLRCYGVNTGVGALCDVLVDEAQQSALSHRIVMSHACGVGEPLSVSETRAIMACAINNFARGYSGIRPIVVERLAALLDAGLIPVVPRAGSIGYLSHMAHVALVLIGAGQVHGPRGTLTGREALDRLALAPLVLEAKEGLSLVNGTPCATGLACVALERAHRLLDWADVVAAMTFENAGRQLQSFAPEALRFRVSDGIAATGARLNALLAGSGILAHGTTRTQDAMSLRAVPQVHGAARDFLAAITAVVERELSSVTDNPIIAGAPAAPVVHPEVHAIGTALAIAMDTLAIAMAKVAATSERRIDRLVNPLVSGLPAFLSADAGVSTGFMVAQCTTLSLAVENRRLCAPASLDGGVSSGLQEDEIPHATPAALKALKVIENLETILAIELLAAAQAYEFQDPARTRAQATDAVYRRLREHVRAYADDRPLASDFAAAIALMRQVPATLAGQAGRC